MHKLTDLFSRGREGKGGEPTSDAEKGVAIPGEVTKGTPEGTVSARTLSGWGWGWGVAVVDVAAPAVLAACACPCACASSSASGVSLELERLSLMLIVYRLILALSVASCREPRRDGTLSLSIDAHTSILQQGQGVTDSHRQSQQFN